MSLRPELIELDTFGIPCFLVRMHGHEPLTAALVARAKAERRADPRGRNYQGESTWHSQDELHRDPDYADLRSAFDLAIEALWARVGWRAQAHPWEHVGLWVNISGPGCATHTHEHWGHGGSTFSGTYYAQVPPGSGGFRVENPDAYLTRVERECVLDLEPFSVPRWFELQPAAGDLALFPSWVEHCVMPNRSDVERISWTGLFTTSGLAAKPRGGAERGWSRPERGWLEHPNPDPLAAVD
ncbi:TIGR02466 family protein [Enhygromyxa salina]|nr:TIGR02466 family protein [Enhygromyxa salina]